MTQRPLNHRGFDATLLLAGALLLTGCGGGDPEEARSAAAVTVDMAAPSDEGSGTARALGVTGSITSSPPPPASTAPQTVSATDPGPGYFVDSVSGADANDGSFSRPWRSLSKLTTVRATATRPFYLKCNGFWRESLRLTATQLAAGAGIASYGGCTGTMPTLSGADSVSGGWVKSGQVWSRSVGTGKGITQVFINGKPLRLARWPNTGSGDGFALSTSASPANPTSLRVAAADVAALTGRDVAGAGLQLRRGGGSTQTLETTQFNASTGVLNFGSVVPFNVGANAGYVLQNKLWMLDSPGEYFYDNATGRLHVWPADAASQLDLNAAAVEASVRDLGLEIRNTGGVFVRGIAFTKTRQNGLLMYDAGASSLDGIRSEDHLRSGVQLVSSTSAGSNGTVVKNSSFARNWQYGIDATSLKSGLVQNNTVVDTGVGMHVGHSMAGIWSGPGTVVDGNAVSRSGLTGIRFSGALGSRVSNNIVTDACLRFSDCGAIYTWNGPARADSAVGQGATVEGNVVTRLAVNTRGGGDSPPGFNAAIYLDDYSHSVRVLRNRLHDVPIGIFVHNTSQSTVEGNTVATPSQAGLWANMDHTSADHMVGNVFRGNQIVTAVQASGSFPATPVPQTVHAIWFWHKLLGQASITSGSNRFEGNDILQLNDPTIPVAWVRSPSGDQQLLGAGWAALSDQEPLPRSPAQFALYRPTLGNELVGGGNFDGGLGAWGSWFQSLDGARGTLQGVTLAGCSGPCAVFAPLSIHDTMISPAFNLSAGALYQVSLRASFARAGTASRPGLRNVVEGGSAVASAITTSSVMTGQAGQTLGFTGTFTATGNHTATLRLAASAGTVAGFDSISIRRVTNFATSRTQDWIGTVSAGTTALNVTCGTLAWPTGCRVMDLDGREVTLPFSLPAASAKTLLRMDSAWRTR